MTRTLVRTMGAAALAGVVALAGSTALGEIVDADRSGEIAAQIDSSTPRNVILIIGDGMDDSMITAARNYELGADGRFALDELPFTGAMTTHGLKVGAGPDYPIAYVSDSAPTASAWSTGRKTVDSRVSQGPSTALEVAGTDYQTVLEKYAAAGKRTGNVSTAEITDATPAAAASHINNRACQGPANMATCQSALKSNGGKGSIAEQLVDNDVDVILGGGASRYAQATQAGPTVRQYAEDQLGYRVVSDKAGLAGVSSVEDGPVLGLFASGNMTPYYSPLVAQPGGAGSASTTCQPANRGNQPSLSEMTRKAIELLDNEDGFFLQTESAMIDKQEHASDICGAIGDLREIDETVKVALEYQAENPDTLVIVTGDHSHSTQIVGGPSGGKQTATVRTADGDPLTVAYSTQDSGSAHTGSQIRVAAKGPQAANVLGTIDQTDLFDLMLGKVPSTPAPTATFTVPATATRSEARATGIAVSSTIEDADRVRLTVEQAGRTLLTTALETGTRTTKVRVPKAVEGELVFTLTATGEGGEVERTRTVLVVR